MQHAFSDWLTKSRLFSGEGPLEGPPLPFLHRKGTLEGTASHFYPGAKLAFTGALSCFVVIMPSTRIYLQRSTGTALGGKVHYATTSREEKKKHLDKLNEGTSSRLIQSFYTHILTTQGAKRAMGDSTHHWEASIIRKYLTRRDFFFARRPLQPSVLLTQVFTTVGVVQHKSHSGSPNCMNYTAVKSS